MPSVWVAFVPGRAQQRPAAALRRLIAPKAPVHAAEKDDGGGLRPRTDRGRVTPSNGPPFDGSARHLAGRERERGFVLRFFWEGKGDGSSKAPAVARGTVPDRVEAWCEHHELSLAEAKFMLEPEQRVLMPEDGRFGWEGQGGLGGLGGTQVMMCKRCIMAMMHQCLRTTPSRALKKGVFVFTVDHLSAGPNPHPTCGPRFLQDSLLTLGLQKSVLVRAVGHPQPDSA